jgi:hypothetical protein
MEWIGIKEDRVGVIGMEEVGFGLTGMYIERIGPWSGLND